MTGTEHRFAFGENWENFSHQVTYDQIDEAVEGLRRLLPDHTLAGKSVLDIGCGSGLHALSAIRLGARSVTAFDLDPQSVQTTRKILSRHAPDFIATIEQKSILEAAPGEKYDVVYSWGVLHHTGQMWQAIKNAAAFVAPGGSLVIAIYKKTPLCAFWSKEKLFYTRLPAALQAPVTTLFSLLFLAGLTAKGTNPVAYVRNYKSYRGMNFWHDMIDWLGGYPYESATPEEIKTFVAGLGFQAVAEYNTHPSKAWGLFGTGCAEYVFTRPKA